MKQRERPDQRAVGLQELPGEALRSVEADRKIKPVFGDEGVAAKNANDIADRERHHGGALVKLHRVARDAVAEIVAPGQRRRRAIREVVNPGEEAADAADRDADRERKRKSRAGPAHDAGVALVELDRDDAPSDGAFNRAREAG